MYIYLSNRKRKSYLSLALPQNLSGKSLSFKDLRFLNQNVGQKNKEKFSSNLKSQQKFLYEKHISKTLISQIFLEKKDLHFSIPYIYKSKNFSLQSLVFILQKLGKSQLKSMISPFFLWKENKKRFSDQNCYSRTSSKDLVLDQKGLKPLELDGKETNSALSDWSVFKPTLYHKTKTTEKDKIYTNSLKKEQNKPWGFSFSSTSFPSLSSLSVYIQKIKISKRKNIYINSQKSFTKKNENLYIFYKENIKDFVQKTFKIDFLKKKKNLFFPNIFSYSYTDKKEILAYGKTPPLFLNGLSQKLNSTFLYRIEQFKTCFKPFVIKKANVNSRGKNLLHERKKIALYYGQIGKKDINQICQKAKTFPGLFEDNLYTLLESRVDVLVYRAGFSKTINSARILIRNGFLELNGKEINSCKIYAKPGDFFSLKKKNIDSYKNTTISLYNCFINKEISNFQKSKTFSPGKVLSDWSYGSLGPKPTKTFKKDKTFFLEKNYNTLSSKKSIIEEKEKSFLKRFSNSGFNGFCTIGFLLYKNIVLEHFSQNLKSLFLGDGLIKTKEKTSINPFLKIKNSIEKSKKSVFFSPLKKYSLLLNVYCATILEKKTFQRKNLWKKKKDFFKFFMKNIQNANYASIWGQKPIHLEISQKTSSFIYLYKPQKIISPLCMDLNILRFLK